MSYDFQNVNLTHYTSYVGLVLDFVFLKDFDGNFFLCELVDALTHLSKSTWAYCLTNEIVADEAIINCFLATLRRLPVTLLPCLLLFELGQGLAKARLQALPLCHFIWAAGSCRGPMWRFRFIYSCTGLWRCTVAPRSTHFLLVYLKWIFEFQLVNGSVETSPTDF